MTPYSANPFIYIFSVAAIGGVLLYYVYGAIDQTGLDVSTTAARVTDKQFTKSGRSYYTTIAGGRTDRHCEQTSFSSARKYISDVQIHPRQNQRQADNIR